ncbi:VOC family protein [Cobetia marina]|uniref:VOC family protein n=1 Tax=Cobetia marina TaxID=28258 RepID=UPI00174BCF4F
MSLPRQSPQGIDYPLVTVRDHAEALALYRRMGFAPSPVSYHPWGSVTSLMMFRDNFIEVIGIDDASKFGTNSSVTCDGERFCFGRQLGEFLTRGEEGVPRVALHSRDADADHQRLTAAGLPGQGRIDFRRKMTLPDGRDDEAVVSLALFIDPTLPDASNFLCHQHRPELIWVEGWQQHPNEVDGITAITYLAEPGDLKTPHPLEARWRAIYGDAVAWRDGVLEADTGCGMLRAVDAAQAAREFPQMALPASTQDPTSRPHAIAIRLNTRNPHALRELLTRNSVSHRQIDERTVVDARAAGNVLLEFVGAE